MKGKRKLLLLTAALACLALLSAVIPSVLVGRNDAALASTIARNAAKTARDIRCYYAQVEMSSEDNGDPGGRRTERCDIWARGHDRMRVDVEIAGPEGWGCEVARSTTILNGHRVVTLNAADVCIYENCPPFDYMYGEFFNPFVLPDELNALLKADLIKPLGEEEVNGRRVYKIDTKRINNDAGKSAGVPGRELRWVEKDTSICLRKERYLGGKLLNSLEVVR